MNSKEKLCMAGEEDEGDAAGDGEDAAAVTAAADMMIGMVEENRSVAIR